MTSSAESMSLASGLLGGGSALLEGVVNELSALSIFLASFLLWHFAKAYRIRGAKQQSLPVMKPPAAGRKWEQRPSPQQKCETHHEASQECVIAVQGIEKQMCEYLRQKEFTRALNLFRSLERDGREQHLSKEEFFSSFVQSAIRVEKVDVVEKLLRVAKRNGIDFTLRSWKSMLKVLSAKKRFDVCLMVYSLFEESLPVDQVVFSCLINAALESNRKAEAAKILRRYRSADGTPQDFVLFFRTYAALGDVESAVRTFDKAGSATTSLMLNLLLLTCINAKQIERAERCLRTAHELEKVAGNKIANAVSYNTIMKGFAQEGLKERCFACFQELLQNGVEPDDTTVCMLVDACLQDAREGAEDRRRCFREAMTELLKQSGAQKNTVMCTHFLKFLVKTDCLEDACKLYEDMKRSERTRPDVITCSMLIKAYVNAHDIDRALYILDDMVAEGCNPDDLILSSLLDACRQQGRPELSFSLFERFMKLGVKPSDYTILTLLKLLGSAGKHNIAHELVSACESRHGIKPSVIHYTCLMSGALLSKEYNLAWHAYLLMLQQGVQPDATAISTLLPGLVAAQNWERVVVLVDAASTASPPINVRAEMLNNALSQMIMAGAPQQHITKLQVLMRGTGAQITTRNVQRLK